MWKGRRKLIKLLETVLKNSLLLRQSLACLCLLSAKITGMNTPRIFRSFVLSQYIALTGLEFKRYFYLCLPNSGIKRMCHHHAQPNL